jgi:fatty acid CoA ligase FadD9
MMEGAGVAYRTVEAGSGQSPACPLWTIMPRERLPMETSSSFVPERSDERETRALAALYEHDQQLRDTRPDPEVGQAIARPGLSFPEFFTTLVEGYGDRPALGDRATEPVTDPETGRTSLRLLPRFDTISYRELGARVEAASAEWHHDERNPVRDGDFVAVLGVGSIDYLTVDIACTRLGATVVPLQSSATVTGLAPIIDETGPCILASNTELLDTAVDLAIGGSTVRRVVVFDHHPEVDDERERLAAARARLAGSGIELVTLAEVLERGRGLSPAPRPVPDPDRLSLLLYTSGSTGTPKGAMYTEKLVSFLRTGCFPRVEGQAAISLSYSPLSHGVGRAMLFGALSQGGTVNFVATSDLSTLFEDIALVRPTELMLVPRVCEMIFQHFQGELDRRLAAGADREGLQTQLRAEVRELFLGGRLVWVVFGSAPLSADLRAFLEDLLELPVHDVFGSTEAGGFMHDKRLLRPPVLGYRLLDVPELGYFSTDSPHPRGELLLKADTLIPGYFRRPDITAEVFDEDGYYHTGDIMAETAPDHLVYIDRAKNVLKLSQGEFVALSRLETLFATADSVRQIFVHGSSERSYLLAVVVPTVDALNSVGGDTAALRPRIAASIQQLAKDAGLNSYEIPRDFIVETEPFTPENGLLSGARKLMRPKLKEHYGPRLDALYEEAAEREQRELRDLRRSGRTRPVVETVVRAAQAVLGLASDEVSADAYFVDLGGDSLSAVSLSNLLREIFGVDAPVGIVSSPANDLRGLAAYLESALESGAGRPTFATVHGEGSTIARAAELTLDKFIDPATLAAAGAPSGLARTVLLTGANGYLGRFLCLAWLERLAETGGTLVCLVRGSSAQAARARLDEAFDSGDPTLLRRFRELADEHLEVLAGDIGEPELGLDTHTWQRLADTVDVIVHPAALVNHVLPYDQLFGPNVVGTAELIRLAITGRLKPFTYLSSVVVADHQASSPDEDTDIRETSPHRVLDDSYASGYAASKWAGEVLLREAHHATGLPVAVFRSDMILAHSRYHGQLNLPDMFTRLLFSLIVTGIAPPSFYRGDTGDRPRAHYDGLPVDFTAEAIATLGAEAGTGYQTYNLLNSHDDGISLDVFVDWLTNAGHRIRRMGSYAEWFQRFTTALRALPEKQKQRSLLPLLAAFAEPAQPVPGLPTERFRTAVQNAGVGPAKDIPHITEDLIRKYAADLTLLGLL